MKKHTTRRRRRLAKSCAPDLFDWARDADLRTRPGVREIIRRTGFSTALAVTLAELAGIAMGGHDRG